MLARPIAVLLSIAWIQGAVASQKMTFNVRDGCGSGAVQKIDVGDWF